MDTQKEFNFDDDVISNTTTSKYIPLSIKMRPQNLDEIVGQEHILGKNCLLPKLIKSGNFSSILFYGTPGCGKTTLAEVIATSMCAHLIKINAVLSNVAELREILSYARKNTEKDIILFIDEIHRFNKSQQDLLLPDVEQATIRLIGATTHNPGFYINSPLLSRSHLFRLNPISTDDIVKILTIALTDTSRGIGNSHYHADDDVLQSIANMSNGDLRWALNALETIATSLPLGSKITKDDVQHFSAERLLRYDANEDEHYNTISAYIKSMRGCDPDAAIYWLTKMIDSGEDPRFIARRMIIFASEDIGLADSRALPLAVACFEACEKVGLPECAINLSHVTVFLATAPKSNSTYLALQSCREHMSKHGIQSVPMMLCDKTYISTDRNSKQTETYKYSHDYPHNISGQYYMNEHVQFWHPKQSGSEQSISERAEFYRNYRNKCNDS